MTQPSIPPADDPVLLLAVELLDAHVDTVELMLGWADELRWQAHLDYLRALVRAAEGILAAAFSGDEPTVVPATPWRQARGARPRTRAKEGR